MSCPILESTSSWGSPLKIALDAAIETMYVQLFRDENVCIFYVPQVLCQAATAANLRVAYNTRRDISHKCTHIYVVMMYSVYYASPKIMAHLPGLCDDGTMHQRQSKCRQLRSMVNGGLPLNG
jgi:hypothetical protein